MKEALEKLERGADLTAAEMTSAMEDLVSGAVNDEAIERFLVLLRQKGESVVEIAAAARVMRAHALKLTRTYPDLVDTCGTGGDGQRTVNVSTLAAIIACAAGVKIAKHGNRSVSSLCGSADLLEALGVRIDLEPAAIERCIEKTGFGFFFAPRFHPATRHAMPARKKIQGKTLFNLLGPLANPAGARRQVLGVYDAKIAETMARVLADLGAEQAFVVHGLEGLDEISAKGPSRLAELKNGHVSVRTVTPDDFGAKPAEAVRCETKEEAVAQAKRVLGGERTAAADLAVINAAASLVVAGAAANLREGYARAKKVQESGAALKKTEEISKETTRP